MFGNVAPRTVTAALLMCLSTGICAADEPAEWTAPKDPSKTEIVLSVEADADFEKYLNKSDPSFFAITLDGGAAYAWGYGGYSEQKTLRDCRKWLVDEWYDCFIIARGKRIVWPGKIVRQSEFKARRAQYEAQGFKFTAGKFSREIPVAEAQGYVGYLNGYGGDAVDDNSKDVPQYFYELNARGWNVGAINVPAGFYPQDDANSTSMTKALQQTVNRLKALGYKQIVLAGQSSGAWQIAFAGQSIEGVSHALLGGPAFQSEDLEANRDDLIPMLEKSRIPNIGLFQFEDDAWSTKVGDAKAAAALAKRSGGYLSINHPRGFSGHYSAITAPFAYIFGGCVADFLQSDGQRLDSCPAPELSLGDHRWMTTEKYLKDGGGVKLDGAAIRAKMVGKTIHVPTFDAGWEVFFLESDKSARRALIDYGKLKRTFAGPLDISDDGELCFNGSQEQCFRIYEWQNGDLLFVDPSGDTIYGASRAILDGNSEAL
jgi:hypothetical protein